MDTGRKFSYQELFARQLHLTRMSFHLRKVSVYLLYVLQEQPLTPNFFTAGSIVLVSAGVASLLFLDTRIPFILLLMMGYFFDQLDGMWARLKGLSSAWGKFFDGFGDSVKFFIVDLGFVMFYFDDIQAFFGDPRLLVAFFATHFALREFYGITAVPMGAPGATPKGLPLGLTGSGGRYFIIFPAVALVEGLWLPYFLVSFAMHAVSVIRFFAFRYRQEFMRAESPSSTPKDPGR